MLSSLLKFITMQNYTKNLTRSWHHVIIGQISAYSAGILCQCWFSFWLLSLMAARAAEDGVNSWAPVSMWETQKKLMALDQLSSSNCGYLERPRHRKSLSNKICERVLWILWVSVKIITITVEFLSTWLNTSSKEHKCKSLQSKYISHDFHLVQRFFQKY